MERVDYERMVIRALLDLFEGGELNVNPWYQRRSVWTRPQKAYLINSLLEHKPIPSIYVRHYIDIETEKSIREVVDGQQRIRCVLEYVNGKFAARHPNHNNRVTYENLSARERRDFLMTSISIGYLIEADDSDVIEIFGRLNSVAKTLNTQEKRNARFSGEMKQFGLKEAAKRVQLWRDLGVFTANNIARMLEVEFISELTINMLQGLPDHSATTIDRFYGEFDDNFPQQDDLRARMETLFVKIAELEHSTIKDTIFSRSPLFFTLCVVLDSIHAEITKSRLEQSLYRIDEIYNADIPFSDREQVDAEFIMACTASTQRIKQREIRDRYVREKLGLV